MKNLGAFKWHKQFKESREDVEDEKSRHPKSHRTDENVAKVQNLVHSDRSFSTVYSSANIFDKETLRQNLSDDLGIKTVRFSAITMLQHTMRSLSSTFWPTNRLLK
jgi:hypothetical protein